MPYFDAGGVVYVIEDIIASEEVLQEAIAALLSGCRCSIVDSPFVASVEARGFVVDRVVGVGSIVCEPGCIESRRGYRLTAPVWGQGRVISRGQRCLVCGDSPSLSQLPALGIDTLRVGYHEFFDRVLRGGERGVLVLGRGLDPLEVVEDEGVCGVLRTSNPLHPAGALGKPRLQACVERIYRLEGPRARLLHNILYVNDKPVIARLEGMGNALVVMFDEEGSSKYPRIAATLGMLYECGTPGEHM